MKKVILILVRIFGQLYSLSLSVRLKSYRNILYTSWLRNYIGEIGISSVIEKPCQIQGGGNSFIRIGNHSCIQSHSVLACWKEYSGISYTPSISIGDNCSIGEYNHFSAVTKISIGNGLLTGRFVIISDNNHGGLSLNESSIPPSCRKLISKGEVTIGNNVWVGDKVSILSGVTIGDNVIIAANSVVTSDIPKNCLAAGVPAKVIKCVDEN